MDELLQANPTTDLNSSSIQKDEIQNTRASMKITPEELNTSAKGFKSLHEMVYPLIVQLNSQNDGDKESDSNAIEDPIEKLHLISDMYALWAHQYRPGIAVDDVFERIYNIGKANGMPQNLDDFNRILNLKTLTSIDDI